MPKEVLDIFWDRVLLPSIGQCTNVSWVPYLKHTLEEARYKARGADGRRGGWGPPKTIPLSDDDFCDVQKRMEARIRDGGPELSMYGSSFFILEGKGIKLLTKDGQRGHFSGPEEALRLNLPDLDWQYMMSRSHEQTAGRCGGLIHAEGKENRVRSRPKGLLLTLVLCIMWREPKDWYYGLRVQGGALERAMHWSVKGACRARNALGARVVP
ncbi:hypothetical protein EDB19DRAFT_1833506 [Suillus lakei]|nr:hypothetical protein EDB19DRAFT_1833506 [Suillus lakei]